MDLNSFRFSLDPGRRTLYVDDTANGVRMLDADTLAERRFIALPTAHPSPTQAWFLPASLDPIADVRRGHVLATRGSDLIDVDAATGPLTPTYADDTGAGGFITDVTLDQGAGWVYVRRFA